MKLYLEKDQKIPSVIISNSEITPNGYEDKTYDLISWKKYGFRECTDYLQLRDRVLVALNQRKWINLSDEEKDYVISLSLKEDSISELQDIQNKIEHLASIGKIEENDLSRGRFFLIKAWSEHHVKQKAVPRLRLGSQKLYEVIGTYLSVDDATTFFMNTRALFNAYESQGIKGSNDGNSISALFNYIEDDDGLKSLGFTMQNGDSNMDNFIIGVMDVLRHGNY